MDGWHQPSREQWLRRSAAVIFVLACAEALISVLARWPYQFTGQGDPDRMLHDFLFAGTLLSPPLPLLLLFGVATVLVRREDQLGSAANVVLAALCAVMAVGSLGEALAPASPDVPRALQVISGIVAAAIFATLLALCLAAARRRV